MIGLKFGKWEVIEPAGKNSGGTKLWLCRCECGTVKKQQQGSLRFGSTKSCGCSEKTNFKHGLTHSRIYSIYSSMRERCYRKKHIGYKNYGGRGIRVEWEDFTDFYRDMNDSYMKHVEEFGEKQTSIDRINNDGNYSKENCKWATLKEQHGNTRTSRIFTAHGKTMNKSDWAKYLKISDSTILRRLRDGMKIEDVLQNKKAYV